VVVTSKPEEYRAKALECEERAEQTRDPFIKQELIEIAEKWRHMAAHLESTRGKVRLCPATNPSFLVGSHGGSACPPFLSP